MGRFFTGFFVASLLWAGLGYLHVEGRLAPLLGLHEPELAAADTSPQDGVEEDGDQRKRKHKRRKHRRRRRPGNRERVPQGNAVTGDDIGWDADDRRLDMQAGEEQLSGPEIEAGFDRAFGKIRRCLFLVPGEATVRGKLVFGMRVAGNGRPTAVNLSGPAAVTTGEAGGCLRKAARSIHFATFDGPEMVFRYPIELE